MHRVRSTWPREEIYDGAIQASSAQLGKLITLKGEQITAFVEEKVHIHIGSSCDDQDVTQLTSVSAKAGVCNGLEWTCLCQTHARAKTVKQPLHWKGD